MADYPPTPAFGMVPSPAVPPYREASHQETYDYGDPGQSERLSLLEYQAPQKSAAFQRNARIPGISAASMESSIPPLPIYQSGEDSPYLYRRGSGGQNARFEPSNSQNTYINPSGHSNHELAPNKLHTLDHIRPSSRTPATQNVEEGELSEGEFEEAHPGVNRNVERLGRRHDYSDRQRGSRYASGCSGAYDSGGEQEVTSNALLTDIYGRSLDLSRRRSESYSPYEPPNEMEYEPRPAQVALAPRRQLSYQEEYEPPDEFQDIRGKVRQSEYQGESSRVESHNSSGRDYREQRDSPANVDVPSGPEAPAFSSAIKSLHDARKEAQNAILNLLPLKIRFEDYLEEGIDEEVVRRQFESLGVPLGRTEVHSTKLHGNSLATESEKLPTKLTSVPNAQTLQMKHGRVDNHATSHENLTSSEPVSSHVMQDNGRTLDNHVAAELRKDRIVRLLAEKKKKQLSPVMQSDSPKRSTSPETSTLTKPTSTSQSSVKADKERLLRQKMEALQKSREQRAQKAAAKAALTTSTVMNVTVENNIVPKPMQQSTLVAKPPFEPHSAGSTTPVQIVNKQVAPSIPGLFLAAGPTVSQSPMSHGTAPSTTPTSTQRKRPVASDFDRPSSTVNTHKRPFGQSRNDQPFVIDVSDEDFEDGNFSESEIDQPQTASSDINSKNGTSTTKAKSIRELPPLSDFPPRKSFATPSSAMSTPSASHPSKTSVSRPEDLVRKEMEIQEMKRKIAEAERRKRVKQNMSGSQTPRSNDSTSSPAKNNGPSIMDKVEVSVQIERLIDAASRQVDQDQQKLAEAHAQEREKADELKRSEAERRRIRLAEIASNLPVVDAEVEKAQKKLMDLRAEMALIEAAVQKGLNDKKRLAEEMEKLGSDAEEQLQTQKEKLQDLKLEEAAKCQVSEPMGNSKPISKANTPLLVEENADIVLSDVQLTSNPDLQHTMQPVQENSNSDSQASTSHSNPKEVLIGSVEPTHESSAKSSPNHAIANEDDGSLSDIIPGQALEASLEEATALAEVQSREVSSSDIDMDDAYLPDPDVQATASVDSPVGNVQLNSQPDGDSDDLMDVADGESDQYEPPEATPPPEYGLPSLDSPPFSPAPPEAISESSRTDKHNNMLIGPTEVPPPKELRHAKSPILPQDQANLIDSSLASRTTYFTPYESPLKFFHAFRFHPSFEQEVPGGFKSTTYSNSIREDKEFCRYELAGGVCNDASCEFQHFRDIGLAEDAILVELGNSAGYSEDDKPRFVAGLRTVLQGLRQKKTKDFHVIASEIAAYRARFLGDKSKILLLDGTYT